MNNIAIILAAGKGERFNSEIPKQFSKLNGKYVISYSIEEFIKSKLFDKIILVLPSYNFKYIADKYNLEYVIGGNSRTKSVYNALKYIKKYNPKRVLFHEAARPLIKAEDLSQYIEALTEYDCAITSTKITDALYHEDRSKYLLLQAPEAYRFENLIKKYNVNKDCVSIYQQIYPCRIKFISLNHPNDKITYPIDLFSLEHLVKYSHLNIKTPNLRNKNILIFGSSGGIGKELVNKLKRDDINLYTPTHQEVNLEIINAEDLLTRYPKIDVIINLAGVCYKDSEGILKYYDKTMNINLKSNLILIEYAKMLKNKPVNLVFISSSSTTKGRENLTTYSASKIALHSIVESQSEELSKIDIYLNCICPEKVKTSMLKSLPNYDKLNMNEILTPLEVIKTILSYCDTKEYGKIIYLRKGMKI